MREKGTRPKFSRQLRIILAVRDGRFWPLADPHIADIDDD